MHHKYRSEKNVTERQEGQIWIGLRTTGYKQLIYIYISHVNVTQTVPDISPLMPMHQDPLLVRFKYRSEKNVTERQEGQIWIGLRTTVHLPCLRNCHLHGCEDCGENCTCYNASVAYWVSIIRNMCTHVIRGVHTSLISVWSSQVYHKFRVYSLHRASYWQVPLAPTWTAL